jgi:hypothetical protein
VRPPTTVTAYLAGPDVFLRNAVEHTTREVAICQRFSFRGLPLLNQDVETVAKGLKQNPAFQMIFSLRTFGGDMSDQAVEILITNAIHTAFIKYPEGDGGPNLDYEWIAPDQSTRIAKAILLDLAANGYVVMKKGAA